MVQQIPGFMLMCHTTLHSLLLGRKLIQVRPDDASSTIYQAMDLDLQDNTNSGIPIQPRRNPPQNHRAPDMFGINISH